MARAPGVLVQAGDPSGLRSNSYSSGDSGAAQAEYLQQQPHRKHSDDELGLQHPHDVHNQISSLTNDTHREHSRDSPTRSDVHHMPSLYLHHQHEKTPQQGYQPDQRLSALDDTHNGYIPGGAVYLPPGMIIDQHLYVPSSDLHELRGRAVSHADNIMSEHARISNVQLPIKAQQINLISGFSDSHFSLGISHPVPHLTELISQNNASDISGNGLTPGTGCMKAFKGRTFCIFKNQVMLFCSQNITTTLIIIIVIFLLTSSPPSLFSFLFYYYYYYFCLSTYKRQLLRTIIKDNSHYLLWKFSFNLCHTQ